MPLPAVPAPDAKPWQEALLGPALSSRRFAAAGRWPTGAMGPQSEVLRRV